MPKQVEFLFDFGSLNAYLAYTQLPGLAARAGADILWTPLLLGGVFKATGNVSPATLPAKRAYMERDTERFLQRHPAPFARNPHFPVNTLTAMRGAVAYQLRDRTIPGCMEFPRYVQTCFDGMWVRSRDLGDPEALAALLAEAGFDAEQFLNLVGDAEVKDTLRANTEDAVARGVFGAPSFFVGEELYFGKDRLDEVQEALMEL